MCCFTLLGEGLAYTRTTLVCLKQFVMGCISYSMLCTLTINQVLYDLVARRKTIIKFNVFFNRTIGVIYNACQMAISMRITLSWKLRVFHTQASVKPAISVHSWLLNSCSLTSARLENNSFVVC